MVAVISLFCGCGGSSLGYQKAGCKIALAADFNPTAIETYRLNFPRTKTLVADVRELTGSSLLAYAKLKALDVLDGSPPCTPFSLAGERERTWGKSYVHNTEHKAQRTDDLFFEFTRLLAECRPKAFVAENVAGLIKGNAKRYYNEIISRMKTAGYFVLAFLLNARDFEVAQSRERVFFVGIRNDVKPDARTILVKNKPIPFVEAVRGLENSDEELEYARRITRTTKDGNFYYIKQGKSLASANVKGIRFNYVKADLYAPIPTVTAHSNMIAHPTENRWITLAELKRCSSFPDWFKFKSINEGWNRIGNSVPPNLAMHVARYAIKKAGLSITS